MNKEGTINYILSLVEYVTKNTTPAPWWPINDFGGTREDQRWRAVSGGNEDGIVFATHEWDTPISDVDMEFICLARTALPLLASEVERLRAVIEELPGDTQTDER